MQLLIVFRSVLLSAAIINVILAFLSWRRRSSNGALAYCGLMLVTAFYAGGYAFELGGSSMSAMLFWLRVEYIGIPFIPLFWLLMTLQYAEKEKYAPPYLLFIMLGISFTTLVLNYTNEFHHLYYKELSINTEGPFPILEVTPGLWYYVQTIYINLSLAAGNILLLRALIYLPVSFRKQSAVIILVSLLPWVAYTLYFFDIIPWGLDATPLAFTPVGLVSLWGLFRFQMFDLVPVAREHIFESMEDGVIVLDNSMRIVDFNRSAATTFNLSPKSLGISGNHVFSAHDPLKNQLWGKLEQTVFNIIAGEEEHHYDSRLHPVLDRRQRQVGHTLIVHDITQHVGLMRRLETYSRTDDLTKAYNRRYFMELGEQEFNKARLFKRNAALIIFDLDSFKEVNDTWGHKAGDIALEAISQVCQLALRSNDIFGRYGGDEFAIFLPETTFETAYQIAERLRIRIAQTMLPVGSPSIYTTASFGVTDLTPVSPSSLEEMIKNADSALYQAKDKGRNCTSIFSA